MSMGDTYAVLVMLLAPLFPWKFILYGAGWLIIKGGLFAWAGNLISFLDVGFGIYLIFVAFGITSTILTVIAVLYLGQKILFSVLG